MRTYSIRRFNTLGITEFYQALDDLKGGKIHQFDFDLVESVEHTDILDGNISVNQTIYSSKLEMITYLHSIIDALSTENKYFDTGLWTWLSAVFIDSLCPLGRGSNRKVGAIDRHILNLDHWARYNRHLLAAPVRLYSDLTRHADFIFSGPAHVHGELFEQLMSRQAFATSQGVVEATKLLYWDKQKLKIKKNVRDKNGPGILRRLLLDILPQFQMTYDLNSMSGPEIIELLPNEFKRWKPEV